MDKTKKFILQCTKAEEIQRVWIPNYGHFYTVDGREAQIICYPDTITFLQSAPNGIWLPTQSQLQKMVGVYDLRSYLKLTAEPGIYEEAEYLFKFTSMEQLWLGLVYAQKYSKYWEGSDWVFKKKPIRYVPPV